jgi:hypothetical protein
LEAQFRSFLADVVAEIGEPLKVAVFGRIDTNSGYQMGNIRCFFNEETDHSLWSASKWLLRSQKLN